MKRLSILFFVMFSLLLEIGCNEGNVETLPQDQSLHLRNSTNLIDKGPSFIELSLLKSEFDKSIGVKEESDKQADGIIYDETLTGVGGPHTFDVSMTWSISEADFDGLITI